MAKTQVNSWLGWAVLFLLVGIVSALFGFGLISGISITIAKWIAMIFVILFVVTIIAKTVKQA